MASYPLIEKGQRSHKYALLRASGATLLRLGASLWVPPPPPPPLKEGQWSHNMKNGLVPPCSILLYLNFTRLLQFNSNSPGSQDGDHYCMCANGQLFLEHVNRCPFVCVISWYAFVSHL